MTPHEVYKTFLAVKQHFCNDTYDYKKYNGKIKGSIESFHKRKDRIFFEKLSRQKKDNEILDFFVSNFVIADNSSSVWMPDIIQYGNENYIEWQKRQQSLSYLFEQDLNKLTEKHHLLDVIKIENKRHPIIVKELLSGNIMIETVIILNSILNFQKTFDEELIDPIWEMISKKMKKYSSFLQFDRSKFVDILRQVAV